MDRSDSNISLGIEEGVALLAIYSLLDIMFIIGLRQINQQVPPADQQDLAGPLTHQMQLIRLAATTNAG